MTRTQSRQPSISRIGVSSRLPMPGCIANALRSEVFRIGLSQEYLFRGRHEANGQENKLINGHERKHRADQKIESPMIGVVHGAEDLVDLENHVIKVKSQQNISRAFS